MEMNVCSIKRSELITTGSTMHYELRRGSYVYLEAGGNAKIQQGTQMEDFHPGDVVIGQKFQIHNTQEQCLLLRGFTFRCNSPLRNPNRSLVYRNVLIGRTISNIFDQTNCPIQLNHQISQYASQVLELLTSDPLGKEACPEQRTGKMDKRLIMINRYIRDHFQQPLTLLQLADLISCNPIYLSNTYSKVFRISPIKHIQNLRMEKARELLITGKWNIGQIANELGYVSASQFSDLFKKYYHVTPSQYRVSHELQKRNLPGQGGSQ